MNLALVLPRFGAVVGGAELHGKWLAEHLQAWGHHIEIFTTCALDHATWENALKPGVEVHNGIQVNRFLAGRRDQGIHGELERAIVGGTRLTKEEEIMWLRNGVFSPHMEGAIQERLGEFDFVMAMPYLFGTTYFAMQAARQKGLLIPCLHDEPYVHLRAVREMLESVGGIMFNTQPEEELAKRLTPFLAPSAIVGLGFETPKIVNPASFRRKYKLGDAPILLYVGRREGGKNVPGLIDCFMRYKFRRPSNLRLVLAGSGPVEIPRRPDISGLQIDWELERDSMYAASTVVCQPSVNESLSIVLMQAWMSGHPVLVHGRGAVTRFHCSKSNGGLWYTTYAEFEEALDRLLDDARLRSALGANGQAYAEKLYSWDAVRERFHGALELWKDRALENSRNEGP